MSLFASSNPAGAKSDAKIGRASTMAQTEAYDFNAPDAIASDGTHVWVVNSGDNSVEELDASTGDLVQTLSGGNYGFSEPDAVVFDGSHIWVANQYPSSLTEIDASTGTWIQTLSTGYDLVFPQAMAFDGTDIWITDEGALNEVIEINASTGALVNEFENSLYNNYYFDGPSGVATDGSDVWITNQSSNTITEIDAATGALVRVIQNGSYGISDPTTLAYGDGSLWIPNRDGSSITELDASTGGLIQQLSGGSYGFAEPESLLFDGSNLWVANAGDSNAGSSVTELDAANGAWIQALSGGNYGFADPDALAFDGTNIWAANGAGNSVTELDASTGAWVQTLYANASPPAISGTPPSPVAADSEYDFGFSLTGTPTPTTSVTSGELPPGLTLSTAGVITGIPTSPGTYSATVAATNPSGPPATEPIAITVTPAIAAVAVDPASGAAGGSVDLSGVGFDPGESVNVDYDAPTPITLCASATVAPDGSFACTGSIPSPSLAGVNGSHIISATGETSSITAETTFKLVSASPTLTVRPSSGLVGNRSVRISGKHWWNGSPVQVNLCTSNPVLDPGSCSEIANVDTTHAGSWSVDDEPEIGQAPEACGTQCYVQAIQGGTDLTAGLEFNTPSVEIEPSTDDGYYDYQKVVVAVKNFPARDPVTIEICANSIDNCDSSTATSKAVSGRGDATFHSYLMNSTICSTGDPQCFLMAQDSAYSNGPIVAIEDFDAYCGPIVCGGFVRPRT
jgi:Putative Ig domain